MIAPVLLLALATAATAADGPAPGSVVDRTAATAAASLLPPEILAHYEKGDYRNTVARWPEGPAFDDGFLAASRANAGRYGVDARGTIVDKDGKPASGIHGLPFRIATDDPQAAVKVIWNMYYAQWRIGSTHDVMALEWIGKSGRERFAVLESHLLYYEGAPPARAPKQNPLGLATQLRATVTAPADLNGTATLAWRFRAAEQRDQSWTYVPALRRVRQVSAANRSDGFLGSDLSQDDGGIFDGKPEDFTWKLVGERDALVLADPRSLTGKTVRRARPDGSVEEEWPADERVVGHQDPAWEGVAWAPLSPVLVRRKLWVVEAAPRDPYYLFARIELGLDQETFQGAISRKFDASGGLQRTLQFLLFAGQPIQVGSEKLVLNSASMGYICAENVRAGRATVIGATPTGKIAHERRMPVEADLFSLERLTAGK